MWDRMRIEVIMSVEDTLVYQLAKELRTAAEVLQAFHVCRTCGAKIIDQAMERTLKNWRKATQVLAELEKGCKMNKPQSWRFN